MPTQYLPMLVIRSIEAFSIHIELAIASHFIIISMKLSYEYLNEVASRRGV